MPDRPGYLFLICPDAELLHQHIEDVAPASAGFERKVYWGDEDLPPKFWQDLGSSGSLFGTKTALVVRRANTFKVDIWNKLAPALAGYSDAVLPFFCIENDWDRKGPKVPKVLTKQKFWSVAEKNKWVWQSPGLTRKNMSAFVRRWADGKGIQFAPGGQESICRMLPEDAAAARLELDKLELAAGESKRIGPEHAELIAPTGDMEFFDFFNTLSEQGATRKIWEEILKSHAGSDPMLFKLLGFLAREARNYWMLIHGEESKVRMPPFVKNKKVSLARRLGPKGIAELFDLALEAETGVKSGSRSPEQALEILAAGMSTLFAPRR